MEGSKILKLAKNHIGERYVLGARAILSNPNHRGPWDCAEFASWCAYQTYGIVFGAYGNDPTTADPYSGKWYEDAEKAGTLIGVDEALSTPGAFVVRKPGDFNTKIGHIGICAGEGRLYEARSTSAGVVLSDDAPQRHWTAGLQLPGILYKPGTPVVVDRSENILRIRHPFMRGDAVRLVQCVLRSKDFDPKVIDSVYGNNTASAVANFQLAEGLVVDGEVGKETATALGIGWPVDTSLVDTLCQGIDREEATGDESDVESEDGLRGRPDDENGTTSATPARISIEKKGSRDYWAKVEGGPDFYVGRGVPYGSYYGLYQRISDLPKLIGGTYDPETAAGQIGDWGHVLWPTMQAESSGYFCRINTYDRARFTFGCFQMAAHTAGDNLILLMRKLLGFPEKNRYFPDLTLVDGKVHRLIDGQPHSLEREVVNPDTKETELPDFMAYLNPSLTEVDDDEVLNAAKMMLWCDEQENARGAQIEFAKSTIKSKMHYVIGKGIPFLDLPAYEAIWIMDARHQGRAKISHIKSALSKHNRYEALKWMGKAEKYTDRIKVVDNYIQKLIDRHPRFKTTTISEFFDK